MKKIHNPALVPQDIPKRFQEAWNAYDATAIAKLFVENADFINVTGKWWQNKKEIFQAHDFGLRVIFQNSTMNIVKVKSKYLSNQFAIVHAHIRIIGQTPHGQTKAELRETLFIFVIQKFGNIWLCLSAQNTDIVDGKQTHIRDEEGNLKPISYKEKIKSNA